MEEKIVTVIVTLLVAYLGSLAVEQYKRRNALRDKEDEVDQDISRERIISDRMIAERMMEKVDKQEILIGELRDNLAAKDARIAVLELRLEAAQAEIKGSRGDHHNVE